MKNIAYITGTRADFGLMTPVLHAIEKSNDLKLSLYATGMHLMPEFGSSINDVKKVFSDVKIINTFFKSNKKKEVVNFTSELLKKLVGEFEKDKPDIILVLGDRPEMLAVATASIHLGIPVAHIHGGERTGTTDEVVRHAITKLSHLHFVATRDSAERVKKLGEESWRIHIVGAPALDTILTESLLTKKQLELKLDFNWKDLLLLVIQHPVSEFIDDSAQQMKMILEAVKKFNLPTVIIYPNADPGSEQMIQVIEHERKNKFFHVFKNLEYKVFLSLVKNISVWIGNSSGAMIESSSFHVPVVNIGARQNGRIHGENVINVDYDINEITAAIKKSIYDDVYRKKIKKIKNPWGNGNTGVHIAKILKKLNVDERLLNKYITY